MGYEKKELQNEENGKTESRKAEPEQAEVGKGNPKITDRQRELTVLLNTAARAYYQESREIMPNYDYDRLYDELLALEKGSGTVLSGSPTQKVGYEVLSELPKEAHAAPMLSLDKTKSVEALRAWLGDQKALLSWKLDGLTVVLTYENGELVKAVTRGNGTIGEVITNNVRVFRNVPLKIPFRGHLVLRGEALMRYSDFERINETIPEAEAKYKNPRNLCAGTVRQLDPRITEARGVYFRAFFLVEAGTSPDISASEERVPGLESGSETEKYPDRKLDKEDLPTKEELTTKEEMRTDPDRTTETVDFDNSREAQFRWLQAQGFDTVEYRMVTADSLPEAVADFEKKIADNDFPSDGLVLLLEDIAYGASLGTTAKFPRNSIAFKWTDETRETTLKEIEWSPSRTGLINPVAIFAPVELEGTTVSRASVHNVSIVRALKLGVGDTIRVYKANMIIPQIAENLTGSDTAEPPAVCPVCGQPTVLKQENDVVTLHCPNPACAIKKLKRFSLMASRDALNVDGLSEATLEKLIAAGFIHEYADLFSLEKHREEIAGMEGFGEKSAENLLAAIEKARHTDLIRFIYSLGIPGIGLQNAKMLSRHFGGSFEAFRDASEEELCGIEGIGGVLAKAIRDYFADPENLRLTEELRKVLELPVPRVQTAEEQEAASLFAGKTFVITGSVNHFKNREALKAYIEERGGKAAGSVSAKTSFLINNDAASSSSKNRKARELGIPILTEEEFLAMAGGTGEKPL